MKEVTGDLIVMGLIGDFDVIVHGANCFNTMNSGIAKQIREMIPGAYDVDCATEKGDISKLGNYSVYQLRTGLSVVNAYTQFNYGYDNGSYVNYDAMEEVFRKIAIIFKGKRIAYPAIGCGLAGGNWKDVSKIINNQLKGEDHTFVKYNGIN